MFGGLLAPPHQRQKVRSDGGITAPCLDASTGNGLACPRYSF